MNTYAEQFRGNFKSALRWHDLDDLWKTLRALNKGQWFVYHVGDTPPTEMASTDTLEHFIDEVDQLLHEEHEEDYCGIVYADNLEQPSMIKIFDPNNLGVSCGYSDNPPLPGWVLSLTSPQDLPQAFPPPGNRKRWWEKIFSS